MRVVVNGNEMDLEAPASVGGLLQACGLQDKPCAVEVNRHVVPRRDVDAHELTDGDRIEIVTLVGGG